MRVDSRHRFLTASFLAATLAAAPVAANDKQVQQLGVQVPKICAELQKQGWGVPADQLAMDPKAKAEMRIGELMYLCMIERQLAGKGPGRAPELTALLSATAGDASLILSANVWCAADREPTLEALAQEVERVLTGSKIPVASGLLEAIRASRQHDTTSEGMRYRVEPIEVDAGACDRVRPGQLGPVLMKMDVAIQPVS